MNTRDTLYVEDGFLHIGGFKAVDLASRFGTPLYVMDAKYIREVLSKMNAALKTFGDGAVAYASKAFSTLATTSLMAKTGAWFDCVSGGEQYLLLKAGVDPKHIIFHGNAKTRAEIRQGLETKIGYFVIDSESEIDQIDAIAAELGVVQDVLVRVNPCVSAHTFAAVRTAAPDSKFGFDYHGSAFDAIKKITSKSNLNFKGIHTHIGSQIYDHTSYTDAIEILTDFALSLKNGGIEVDVFNLGGGFGIYYTDENPKFTPNRYAYTIKNIAYILSQSLEKKGLKKPFLIFEPGRSVVGEAGVTLYTVTSIKNIPDVKKYVAVDGGMFENPRFALYGAKYSAVIANRADERNTENVTIVGKCCESGDIISENVQLPTADAGDILAVFSTGAYNYSMASNYNLNGVPPVVLVDGDKADLIVKGQSFEDLLRNNVVPEWI